MATGSQGTPKASRKKSHPEGPREAERRWREARIQVRLSGRLGVKGDKVACL